MDITVEKIWNVFIEMIFAMSPYLLLGLLFAGLLHVFFPKKIIVKYLGQNNLKSVVNAAILGVPLPLCSCGVIPTAVSLYKDGASKGSAISFLISTPQTGVDSILATYSLLGLPFAVIRPVIAFLTGIFGGWIANIFFDKKKEPDVQDFKAYNDQNSKKTFRDFFKYAFVDFLSDISKWLLLGIVIAVAITILIPDDFFAQYIPNNILGMLIILVAAIPMYVCATGSIPIAMALMMKGLSPGAALVFLMAGPATNAATITVISKILKRNALIVYLASIILGSILFGILIDYIFPSEWFNISKGHMHHHVDSVYMMWIGAVSSVLLGVLILNGFIQKYKFKQQEVEKNKVNTNAMNVKIIVKGMTCNHCKMTVENNLRKIDGIKNVVINLATQEVQLEGDQINMATIENTIEGLGYVFGGEKK